MARKADAIEACKTRPVHNNDGGDSSLSCLPAITTVPLSNIRFLYNRLLPIIRTSLSIFSFLYNPLLAIIRACLPIF